MNIAGFFLFPPSLQDEVDCKVRPMDHGATRNLFILMGAAAGL
jgi:hypothetical protein